MNGEYKNLVDETLIERKGWSSIPTDTKKVEEFFESIEGRMQKMDEDVDTYQHAIGKLSTDIAYLLNTKNNFDLINPDDHGLTYKQAEQKVAKLSQKFINTTKSIHPVLRAAINKILFTPN